MNAELRELAILRAARQRSRSASKDCLEPSLEPSPVAVTPVAASCSGRASSQLFLMYDDVVLSILDQLRQSRDVASLISCLATSRQLSCLSREVLRENFPLFELLPELLQLPSHMQSHVSERCQVHLTLGGLPSGLMRGGLYAAVQQLLHGELPPDVVWLVLQQWSSTLEEELCAMGDAHRRWRIGYMGMPKGRCYRLGGLDDKAASEHRFVLHGEEATVADFFAAKRGKPLSRPQLPCILAGPRSSPGLIRLPLELLRFEEPDELGNAIENAIGQMDSRPQPDEILAMPPALRALVEYVSRDETSRDDAASDGVASDDASRGDVSPSSREPCSIYPSSVLDLPEDAAIY